MPCPFCRGSQVEDTMRTGSIVCQDCGASAPNYRAWNRRATPADDLVAWQRHHPTAGWVDCLPADVGHYRAAGQEVRPLYLHPATAADDLRAAEPVPDDCICARIGELGNQIHNLGCEYQNDEKLSDRLAELRKEAWSITRAAALSQPAPTPQPAVQMPRAWLDVMGERTRQMAVEGWTPEHDDAHDAGEIGVAAACYAVAGAQDSGPNAPMPLNWPWHSAWWKPTNRRRDLVKAGALILAEIERLDRAALSQNGGAVVEDAPEPIGNCESCGVDIHEGDKCCHTTDGCVLCVEHAPMLSDVLRQMDEVLEKGEAEGCYDLTEDELREDRDSIAADIAKNGDRKAVSR
ncbi:hypothetical protein [Paracoccus sp. ME4]|uniref:hypothetical protein n=1 Tax=Paracoccus sp. ME4 TaxID=3138066 RepID=UPI00398B043D